MAASLVKDVDMEQASSEPKFREEVYEKLWTIPDWNRIQQSKEQVEAQTFELSTGRWNGPQTKWKLGFRFGHLPELFYLYWKLIKAKGFPDEKVTASTYRWTLREGSPASLMKTPKAVINLGQVVGASGSNLLSNTTRWVSESWINSNGEVAFKLKLIIMEPEVPSAELKTDIFQKASAVQVLTNFARLIGDEASADLKIITNDEKELFAHKAILKVQCPVFESMFRSDLSENQTGVVNVKDVNGKTMGILLHFLYTGNLLPSWKDDDTVVGFTYACGKYQLGNVLKFLDGTLGDRDDEDTFERDVQLVDLARKLDLKNAERELLGRIKKTMNKVNSADEFFDLYSRSKLAK